MKFKLDIKALQKVVIEQLKGAGVKLALKKLLGSAAAAGPKAWLIKFIAENFMDELLVPAIEAAGNYLGFRVEKYHGKKIVIKMNEAREANNGQAYDDATDDVFRSRG